MSGLTERLNQSTLDFNSRDSIEEALSNYARCAAERYDQYVKDLNAGTNGMDTIHEEVRSRLAQQFTSQSVEARKLIEAMSEHGLFFLLSKAK